MLAHPVINGLANTEFESSETTIIVLSIFLAEFIDGVYTYSWDKQRWDRLRQGGWIETWRHRNRTTIMYSVFKTSFKCSQMISRIYRILLGEEDLPTSERSVFYNNESYTDKVYNKAIDDMIKDKDR